MVKPDITLQACFAGALEAFIKREKRGFQTKLSKQVGISRQQLNDIVAKRTHAKDELKDKIAHALGYTVYDLLHIGEKYIKTGHFFPHTQSASNYPPHSKERCVHIMNMAGADMHLDVEGLFNPENLSSHTLPMVGPYLKGEVDDASLYEAHINLLKRMLAYYL